MLDAVCLFQKNVERWAAVLESSCYQSLKVDAYRPSTNVQPAGACCVQLRVRCPLFVFPSKGASQYKLPTLCFFL